MSKLNIAELTDALRGWTAGQEVGFSVNLDGESPRDGYMVAVDKSAETILPVEGVKADDIVAYLDLFRHLLAVPGAYLGGWVSKEGALYLDVSARMETANDAALFCRLRGERAFYGVKEGESVYVSE